MKIGKPTFGTVSFALGLALVLLLETGCATNGSADGVYHLEQTRDNVDFAMARYHNRVAFGFVTLDFQSKVAEAYKAYQSAFNTAFKESGSNYDTVTPPNVKQLADNLMEVLDQIP